MENDTIAAIATGLSPSGIGIIRVSGDRAVEIVNKVFHSNKIKSLDNVESHTIHYGFIFEDNHPIDEVMVSVFLAPNSFTKENTVEINCHGGLYVMKRILEVVVKAGARLAQPGEFTKRAFLNGRIDLTKAESVMDLIQSKNDYALRSSVNGLRGSLYTRIKEYRNQILYEIAFIESALDDPEHISLDEYPEHLLCKVKEILGGLVKLSNDTVSGRLLREGIETVIVGQPNVGKSSLLNYLAGEERAIVTDIAGTTRDTLKETIVLDNIILNITDTAGIHTTEDKIEKIGVEKAKEGIKTADLILYMLDSSDNSFDRNSEIAKLIEGKRVIVLLNKSDLPSALSIDEVINYYDNVIPISAKTGQGIEELKTSIKDMFFSGEVVFNDEITLSNMRQKVAADEAIKSIEAVINSINLQMPEDFYSIDLMAAYSALGKMIGEEVGEELVDEIFSKFCMGK